MQIKQSFHISALNILALVKDYVKDTGAELSKLPNHLSAKLFTKNLFEGLEQTKTLFYPKDWKKRFDDRTGLEKAFSVARYAGFGAFTGLTAQNAVQNGITDISTIAAGTASLALLFLFSAQRIQDENLKNTIKNSKGEITKKLDDTMDRVQALDGVHALFAITTGVLLQQWGYVAMGAAIALSNFVLPALPSNKEYRKIRKAVGDACVAIGIPAVAAVAISQPELKDKIIQALPIIPVTIGIYAGTQTDDLVKKGNFMHFFANASMAATGTLMGLFNVTVANGLGAANWATTIENTDMPVADNETKQTLSKSQRIGAWFGVVKDPTKKDRYLYKSDLTPK